MSRTLFENSKAAMAFAAMTIIGAVSIVGTSDGGGVLGTAVDSFAQQRETVAADAQAFAESQSVGDAPSESVSDPDAGWGSSKSVFGDYDAAEAAKQPPSAAAVAASPSVGAQGNSMMTAPLAPGAVVLGAGDADVPQGVPVITDREMTIEPQ
jgi:hypothetical protein